jgi:hypothetical protein
MSRVRFAHPGYRSPPPFGALRIPGLHSGHDHGWETVYGCIGFRA